MRKDIDFVGISNQPSDYNAQDGVMASLVNLIPENGELHSVAPCTTLCSIVTGFSLLYIHRGENYTNYIFGKTNETYSTHTDIYYISEDEITSSESPLTPQNLIGELSGTDVKMTSVGNTLVTYWDSNKNYFLFDNIEKKYIDLGNGIPEIELKFGLTCEETPNPYIFTNDDNENELISKSTLIDLHTNYDDENWKNEDIQRNVEQQLCAIANKYIADKVTEPGKFLYPFLVRYAIRMYDNSLTMHSIPVLMIPSTAVAPILIKRQIPDDDNSKRKYRAAGYPCFLDVEMLNFKKDIIDKYGDIINSIDIFVSAPIYTYKQSGKTNEELRNKPYMESEISTLYNWHTFARTIVKKGDISEYGLLRDKNWAALSNETQYHAFTLPEYSINDVYKNIEECSTFYLLHSIKFIKTDMEKMNGKNYVIRPISGYLASLINKEVMTDDYDSHDRFFGKYAFVYNSRLNLANIRKYPFNSWNTAILSSDTLDTAGQTTGLEDRNGDIHNYTVVWEINTSQKKIVQQSQGNDRNGICGNYLYNPNAQTVRAYILRTKSTQRQLAIVDLKTHEYLNGAVAFTGFLGPEFKDYKEGDIPELTSNNYTDSPNVIYTSEVNNPFYFPVTGINTVGLGEILGICSTTKALSEGQFGQFPLYAFTDEGVWALAISSTGEYTNVSPISRDVCNNPKSITQIDNAIIFSTARGLLLLSGSETSCITLALEGKPFDADGNNLRGFDDIKEMVGLQDVTIPDIRDFLKDAYIAYDYPRQRILVYSASESLAYAYSLRSNQWGQVEDQGVAKIINSYPDAIAQTEDNNGSKLINISLPDKGKAINGLAITRPISLGMPNILKTINVIYGRGDSMGIAVYGSRDFKNWMFIGSGIDNRVANMHGSPFKAFRFVIISKAMQLESCIKGLSLEYLPKDDNRIR